MHMMRNFLHETSLIILAACTIGVGFIPFGHFVSTDGKVLETPFHLMFSIAPVLIGLTGIAVAMWMYKKENNKPHRYQLH